MLRLVSAAATVIGAITGAATIIGWAVAQDVDAVLRTGTLAAGYAMFAAVLLLAVRASVVYVRGRTEPRKRRMILSWTIAGIATPLVLLASDAAIRVLGGVVIVIGLPSIPVWVNIARLALRRSVKTCPQCAETIKAQANVCRYCGQRFLPPPLLGS